MGWRLNEPTVSDCRFSFCLRESLRMGKGEDYMQKSKRNANQMTVLGAGIGVLARLAVILSASRRAETIAVTQHHFV